MRCQCAKKPKPRSGSKTQTVMMVWNGMKQISSPQFFVQLPTQRNTNTYNNFRTQLERPHSIFRRK